MKKKFKLVYTSKVWGIVDPTRKGCFPDTYNTREQARKYYKRFRKDGLVDKRSRIIRLKETLTYEEL